MWLLSQTKSALLSWRRWTRMLLLNNRRSRLRYTFTPFSFLCIKLSWYSSKSGEQSTRKNSPHNHSGFFNKNTSLFSLNNAIGKISTMSLNKLRPLWLSGHKPTKMSSESSNVHAISIDNSSLNIWHFRNRHTIRSSMLPIMNVPWMP